MIFSTCPVLSLHMSLWSYLDMSHGDHIHYLPQETRGALLSFHIHISQFQIFTALFYCTIIFITPTVYCACSYYLDVAGLCV